jgi:DNA-binding NtrC family response regulator
MLKASNSISKNTIWIIDDNEFIVEILSQKLKTEAPNWDSYTFLSISDAVAALKEGNNLPNIILLDYDFGPEGTANDFLIGLDAINVQFSFKIFIYSNSDFNAAFEAVLLHRQVFGWIEKHTPFSNLLDLLIYNSKK